MNRASRVLSDLAGLFLLPAFIALLPWTLGLRVLRCAARRLRTFRPEADAAWEEARRHVATTDHEAWKERYRLVRWVERADTYLGLMRSTRWWKRHVDVEGPWPEEDGAHLLLTFHWGAGNWIWKLLREQGIHAYFLARRPVASDLGASRIALGYTGLRTWALRRMGCLGPLFTGGSIGRIQAAWRSGDSLVAMLDLPTRAGQRVLLLGRPARLPPRLVELAAAARVPVLTFSCGFDAASGRRRLVLERLPAGLDAGGLVERYARHLDGCLQHSPESWMMWHEARSIFVEAAHTMETGEAQVPFDS